MKIRLRMTVRSHNSFANILQPIQLINNFAFRWNIKNSFNIWFFAILHNLREIQHNKLNENMKWKQERITNINPSGCWDRFVRRVALTQPNKLCSSFYTSHPSCNLFLFRFFFSIFYTHTLQQVLDHHNHQWL